MLLSSIGWVSVTSNACNIHLAGWTPNAFGLAIRKPALILHAAQLKGKRIPGTKAYKPKLLSFTEETIYNRGNKRALGIPFRNKKQEKESSFSADYNYLRYKKVNFDLA